MRRTQLTVCAVLMGFLFGAPHSSSATREGGKPNIVFLIADDLGWTDLACYGSSFYETPHIDRLASEGIKFTQFYCAGSVCSPTRASIVTGQVPARTGCTQWSGSIRGTETCFPKVLAQNGYQTFFTGKWHIGGMTPEESGFTTVCAGHRKVPEDPKSTRQFTEDTLAFLDKQTGQTPFFAYIGYRAVHIPCDEKPELVEKYRQKLISNPPRPGRPKGL
jgi:arylsulfatase A-like enzyme